MREAIAKPYGSAINAAITPPEQSPRNCCQPYRAPCAELRREMDCQGTMASGHDLQERGLELIHFVLGPDGNSDVGGPARPNAADVNLLLAEGLDDLPAG